MKKAERAESRHGDISAPPTLVSEPGYLIGYARVSTEEQILDLQLNALRAAGCHAIYQEKVSGAAKKRPQLELALKDLQPGDKLVVWRLDRLSRDVRDFYARLEQISSAGAAFQSLTENFDSSTPFGAYALGVLALGAQLERQMLQFRTKAGMEAARLRGSQIGAPIKFTDAKKAKAREWIKAGVKPAVVAKRLDLSVGTISAWAKKGVP